MSLAEPLPLDAPGSQADAYLDVVGRRQGTLTGECESVGHENEIGVIAWRWGASAPTAPGTTQPSGRRVYERLEVDKYVDLASTKLLNALATNEELKTVTLALRKSGTDGDDFMKIVLGLARVIDSRFLSSPAGGLYETVAFGFQSIEIEYHPQKRTGQRGAPTMFRDDLGDGG
jgi:type VI secretion system secreted protein Hcp